MNFENFRKNWTSIQEYVCAHDYIYLDIKVFIYIFYLINVDVPFKSHLPLLMFYTALAQCILDPEDSTGGENIIRHTCNVFVRRVYIVVRYNRYLYTRYYLFIRLCLVVFKLFSFLFLGLPRN